MKQKIWRKRNLWLAIPAVVILLAVLIIEELNSPAQGTIVQNPPSSAPADPYSHPVKFSGKYIAFTYPAHYRKATSQLGSGYLEIDQLVSTDHTAKQVTIGVLKEDLNNDSGVLYRRRHTELYKETTAPLGPEFKKLDGTEDTYFVSHNGLVTSIAVVAAYKNLGSDASFIANSLQWR